MPPRKGLVPFRGSSYKPAGPSVGLRLRGRWPGEGNPPQGPSAVGVLANGHVDVPEDPDGAIGVDGVEDEFEGGPCSWRLLGRKGVGVPYDVGLHRGDWIAHDAALCPARG